jgi:DNA-binding SARP family transcriptional activator
MRPDSPAQGFGADIDFGLLGPLEVRIGGAVVPIGSPKLRTLLAALLLNAGRTVPAGTLVELLWDGRDPVRPRSATQVWVSRLRARLAGAAASIVTTADGYRLDVAPESVDLNRFRYWMSAAGCAGDDTEETAAIERALAQWRDDALVDVPSEVLQREVVPALTEQRLQALDRRIELDLRRGRHDQVIEELLGLTARNPLHERLWAHLLTALHRTGRRAEALDAFETVRRNLSDELGIDPGTELRSLHSTVLIGHAGAAAPPTPRQLPAGVTAFTGRAGELARLDAVLAPARPQPSRTVVLTGPPGVGKTALAVHWARRVTERFPDGQLWMDLRGYHTGRAVAPEEKLGRFLRALGVPPARIPAGLADRAGLFRSTVDGRRILIGLDNARDPEQVRPLLPGAPGCLVLMTSRDELPGLVAGEGAEPLTVGLPTVADAVVLLARRLGDTRVRTEWAATMDIIERCDRLPLAMAIVAARAANRPGFPLRAFAAELADTGGRLEALSTGEPEFDVRTAFSWSYRALPAEQARLFRLLSLHPDRDVGTCTAARIAGLHPLEAKRTLDALCRRNLFVEHAPGRYGMHELMRAYATELAGCFDTAAERAAAARPVRQLRAA